MGKRLSPQRQLERVNVQAGLSKQSLELGVLSFQGLQAHRLSRLQAAVLATPLMEARLAEPYARHSSATLRLASACRMNPMVCASLKQLFLISVCLLKDADFLFSTGMASRARVRICNHAQELAS